MSGLRRVVLFVAMVAVALTMGLEFAHVLEWPQKQNYPGDLYVRLQEWSHAIGFVLFATAYLLLLTTSLRWRGATGPGRPAG